MKAKTLIIIPCFQDNVHLKQTIADIRVFSSSDILVVDDGSTPPVTYSDTCNEKIIRHSVNKGLAESVRSGCKFALENGYMAVIKVDSDNQMVPSHIPSMEKMLLDDDSRCDVVVVTFGKNTPKSIRYDDVVFRKTIYKLTKKKLPTVLSEYRGYGIRAIVEILKSDIRGYASPLILMDLDNLEIKQISDGIRFIHDRPFPLKGMIKLRTTLLWKCIKNIHYKSIHLIPFAIMMLTGHLIYNVVKNKKLNGGNRSVVEKRVV